MPYLVAFAAGFLVGAGIGRWWAVMAAMVPAIWIVSVQEVEAPEWVLPVGYGTIIAMGIAAGVATRKRLRRRR